MSYSVLTAKSELEAMLHGTTLTQVVNINGVFNRAGRQLMLDIDPAETKRIQGLSFPIYYGVFDYAAPADLKGNKIVDIIPQTNVAYRPIFTQTYNRNFDVMKNIAATNTFTVMQNTGVKTVRIDYNDNSRVIPVNQMNAIQGNGTWSATGTASNLTANSQVVDNYQGVLSFDITTGSGYLLNSTITATNIAVNYNNSAFFWDFYVPDATKLTSINVRIGSDSSNYWEMTGITTGATDNPFVNGYNQGTAYWANMTTVGTPDNTSITYARIGFVVTGAMSGCWCANLNSNMGWLANFEYYSKYMFSTAAGVWQETVTDESNLINLDTESYNIFLYQAAFLCVQQALGQDAGYDTNIFLNKYDQAVARYKKMYKSEITKPQQQYYNMTNKRYQNYIGYNNNIT